MMGPLLDTKTVVPRVRDAMVDRSRLVTQVETGLRQCLVLVSAPAGFGKTTLLSRLGREYRPVCGLADSRRR